MWEQIEKNRRTSIFIISVMGVVLVGVGMALGVFFTGSEQGALIGGIAAWPGRAPCWVIYNLSARQARQAVADGLADLGEPAEATATGFDLPARRARVAVSTFPLLRNATVRLDARHGEFACRLAGCIQDRLDRHEVTPSPMAVSLLLVATGMLVAPLAMLAPQADEIVRLLTNLLP